MSALWSVTGHWTGRPAPLRVLGGWSSTRVGLPVTYTREIGSAGASALHLRGVVEPLRVSVDDGEPWTVHAEDPYVLLPAGTHRVSVTLPHHPSGGGLGAELLDLEPVTDWSCAAQDDDLLTGFATTADTTQGRDVRLPLALEPGQEVWLDLDLPAVRGRPSGAAGGFADPGDRMGRRGVCGPGLARRPAYVLRRRIEHAVDPGWVVRSDPAGEGLRRSG